MMGPQPQQPTMALPKLAVDISAATVQQLARLNDNIETLITSIEGTSEENGLQDSIENLDYTLSLFAMAFVKLSNDAAGTGKYGGIYELAKAVKSVKRKMDREAESGDDDLEGRDGEEE